MFDDLATMNDLPMDEKLCEIVCQGDLHNELDDYLRSLSDIDKTLQKMFAFDDQHVNLLMLAAQHGFDRVTRILLSHSSNVRHLVNMHGNVIDVSGNLVSHVSALWCACDRSHFEVARTLIESGGANVHSASRNPILINAITDERYDIIEFLIENNYSDINQTVEKDRPFYNGLMIAAAHGQINIVRYLLSKGANVNFTSLSLSNLTALACAASEGQLEIVELLCAAGASTDIKTNNNETPLILAFENNHLDIVDYLFDLTKDNLCLDEIELAASSIVLSIRRINNSPTIFNKMIYLMRKIFQLRAKRNSLKPITQSLAAYNYQQECQTIDEFEKIQHDHHRLYIEALLIRERILLPKKLVSLCEPLLTYGQDLVEQGAFNQCLHLWYHTFHLYQNMNFETSLHRFVWLFCKMILAKVFIPANLFVQICRLTFEPSEQNKKNHSIKNSLCLITIATKVLEQPSLTKLDRQSIYRLINDICRQQRTTTDGQTLLHLCVNEQTYRDINYRANEVRQVLDFPNLAAAQLLLTYGKPWIDTESIDLSDGNTPLHIVSSTTKSDVLPIIELLIQTGAHIDCLNKYNKTPFDYSQNIEIKSLLQKYQIPSALKCLCARFIVDKQINYDFLWSSKSKMGKFIYLHGIIGKQNQNNIV